jgi:sugar phosphate isomerase/epimerase
LAAALADGAPNAEKLGWHLGCQTWTFREFSLFEAIDMTASLGLHYVETGVGMKSLSKEQPQVKFNEDSPVSIRNAVKKKLADSSVMLKSYGVTPLSKDAGQCRKMFDFAKDMGLETIVSEPTEDAFDIIEKLCDQYGINLAIHNHPQPSHYWNPDTVLKVCKGRSKRIGACADTGHWLRSGLNPIDCLKKLEGRIINFHFKDLNKTGGGGDVRDVPWGTGVSDVKGMLTEVRRQGIKAVFLIEYEFLSPTLLQEVAECVKHFDKVAAELAAKA